MKTKATIALFGILALTACGPMKSHKTTHVDVGGPVQEKSVSEQNAEDFQKTLQGSQWIGECSEDGKLSGLTGNSARHEVSFASEGNSMTINKVRYNRPGCTGEVLETSAVVSNQLYNIEGSEWSSKQAMVNFYKMETVMSDEKEIKPLKELVPMSVKNYRLSLDGSKLKIWTPDMNSREADVEELFGTEHVFQRVTSKRAFTHAI